ncbi:MAG: hypothetical protein NVSMB46_00530 [Candidatus Saccharimonadales bacterium]
MVILGLSGTNGSGKDTVAHLLVKKHNFYFASATDMLRDELLKRELPVDRIHKARLSAEWRRQHGMAVIVDRAYQTFLESKEQYPGLIVGSLRHPGEADAIHALNGHVLWIDAPIEVRYKRIQNNSHLRGRIAEDKKTFKEFLAEEKREMHQAGDHHTLSMSDVKARADIFIDNHGTNIKKFEKLVEQELTAYLTSS